jgi:Tfp pilus assembly protein PilO/Tfp pilus assembly protein PilP
MNITSASTTTTANAITNAITSSLETLSTLRQGVKLIITITVAAMIMLLGYIGIVRTQYHILNHARQQLTRIETQLKNHNDLRQQQTLLATNQTKLQQLAQQLEQEYGIKSNISTSITAHASQVTPKFPAPKNTSENNFQYDDHSDHIHIAPITQAIWLKTIATAARANQLAIIALQPTSSIPHPNIIHPNTTTANTAATTTQINITAYGSYQQINAFFAALNQTKLLATITAFNLQPTTNNNSNAYNISSINSANNATAGNDNNIGNGSSTSSNKKQFLDTNKLLLTATINAYPFTAPQNRSIKLQTYNKLKPSIIKSAKHGHSTTNNPFDQSRIVNASQLTAWESKELKLLGIVQHHGKIMGIVGDPSGQVHYASAGDPIGINQSRIKHITKTAIITETAGDNIYR